MHRRPGYAGDWRTAEAAWRLRRRFDLSERAEWIFYPSLTQLRGPTPWRLCGVRGLAVYLLVEDAVAAADDGPRVAVHIPRHAQSRREVVEIALGEARRHARIAGEQNALRRVGHDGGLHARHPGGVTAALLIERDERLVAQAVVHREPRMHLVRVFDECLVLHRGRTVVGNPELDRRVLECADHEVRDGISGARPLEVRRSALRARLNSKTGLMNSYPHFNV